VLTYATKDKTHIAIKYRHFRDQLVDGKIEVEGIDTNDQIADIVTKPFAPVKFKALRKLQQDGKYPYVMK